eukprot:Rhum_TRINITY_DN15264_c17_g1::Rhum_TRINITY_DN15264_c17_g1_i1::g.149288::m.149288
MSCGAAAGEPAATTTTTPPPPPPPQQAASSSAPAATTTTGATEDASSDQTCSSPPIVLRVGAEVRAPHDESLLRSMRSFYSNDIFKIQGRIGMVSRVLPDCIVLDYSMTSFSFDHCVFPPSHVRACHDGCPLSAPTPAARPYACGSCGGEYPSQTPAAQCTRHDYVLCPHCRGVPLELEEGMRVVKGPTFVLTNANIEPADPCAVGVVVACSREALVVRWQATAESGGGGAVVDYRGRLPFVGRAQDFIPLPAGSVVGARRRHGIRATRHVVASASMFHPAAVEFDPNAPSAADVAADAAAAAEAEAVAATAAAATTCAAAPPAAGAAAEAAANNADDASSTSSSSDASDASVRSA